MLKALNHRVVAEIQGNIAKRDKRNAISRRFHAKSDNEAIVAWRSDLNGIIHVFSVRSFPSIWSLLTPHHFQKEPEITHIADSGIRHDVANSCTTVSGVRMDANNLVPDVRHDVSNTHAIASDIHRNPLKSREGADGQNMVVSTACALSVTG